MDRADLIFMAISGTAALKPLVAALDAGKTVALASKEPIVSAGSIITALAKEKGGRILPVDSEHAALMQCLADEGTENVEKVYLTGSGGSLHEVAGSDFDTLSIDRVLSHPKWDMGKKITVDSATLMNKGLEVIEARWLFDIEADKINVIIHPEAIVHSMVQFLDGTVRASMYQPDMRFPILRALGYPDVVKSDLPRIDFSLLAKLTFQNPDTERFPALALAYRALEEGGSMPGVMNASNEAAVELFLNGKIKFTEIIKKVENAMDGHTVVKEPSLDDIISVEKHAFEEVFRSC